MDRGIITISENGAVTIPTVPVWMTQQEMSDAFNPNRSLETEPILFYCRAGCPLLLSKAWRATSRQSNGEDAGKRTKAVGKQNKNINNNQMRSNDRFGIKGMIQTIRLMAFMSASFPL